MDYLIKAQHILTRTSITMLAVSSDGSTQRLVSRRTIAKEPMFSMSENMTDLRVNEVTNAILERYHYQPIDDGHEINNTPLAKHERGMVNLLGSISEDFGLPEDELRTFIQDAIDEVF